MDVPVVAVLDANVLHAIPVCDCLTWVALGGLVRAHWTEEIHEEWIRSLLVRRPDLSRPGLERRRQAMEVALPGARVTGYHRHSAALDLPDPGDCHVLAAAIWAGATHIVTYNRSDFPEDVLGPRGVQAIHPDDLLVGLYQIDSGAILRAVRQQRAQLRKPPITADSLLVTFRKHGLTRLADALEVRSGEI